MSVFSTYKSASKELIVMELCGIEYFSNFGRLLEAFSSVEISEYIWMDIEGE